MENSFLFQLVKELSLCFGPSGNEESVRDIIISYIKDYATYRIDPLGNVIVEKKGRKLLQNGLCWMPIWMRLV